jgi:hypothetical protein
MYFWYFDGFGVERKRRGKKENKIVGLWEGKSKI